MSIATRQQKMAEAAYAAVSESARGEKYDSFAKSFPALIHTAGLCQAVAFAQAKGKEASVQAKQSGHAPGAQEGQETKGKEPDTPARVLADVVEVVNAASRVKYEVAAFAQEVRRAKVTEYLRLTQLTLEAATWVKRYVEALSVPMPAGADSSSGPV